MTPEALVARAMLAAVKRKGGIAQCDISHSAIFRTMRFRLTISPHLSN